MDVKALESRSLGELEGIKRDLDNLVERRKMEESHWVVKAGRLYKYRFNKRTRQLQLSRRPGSDWVDSSYSGRVKDLLDNHGSMNKADLQNLSDIMELIAESRDW